MYVYSKIFIIYKDKYLFSPFFKQIFFYIFDCIMSWRVLFLSLFNEISRIKQCTGYFSQNSQKHVALIIFSKNIGSNLILLLVT